jgi:23S rRNA (adenine2503-C2)-methyltransferase
VVEQFVVAGHLPAGGDRAGSKWTASRPAAQREFVRRLESHGVPVTVRDTRGREIDGACGQLAAQVRP